MVVGTASIAGAAHTVMVAVAVALSPAAAQFARRSRAAVDGDDDAEAGTCSLHTSAGVDEPGRCTTLVKLPVAFSGGSRGTPHRNRGQRRHRAFEVMAVSGVDRDRASADQLPELHPPVDIGDITASAGTEASAQG
jgi:hypothetical protein